jgi:CRISPR/Cas system endoribonuclease Cas6 (RAMP superfamily)
MITWFQPVCGTFRRSANSFDELYEALQQEPTYIDEVLRFLKERIENIQPTLFLISVPFREFIQCFRSAQWLKNHPEIKISGRRFP